MPTGNPKHPYEYVYDKPDEVEYREYGFKLAEEKKQAAYAKKMKFSAKELAVLKEWVTGRGYKKFRAASKDGRSNPQVRTLFDAIDRAEKMPGREPAVLYRGLEMGESYALLKKRYISDKGLASWSSTPGVAAMFGDAVLKVRTQRGLPISGRVMSTDLIGDKAVKSNEEETIMPPSRYRVVSTKKTKYGYLIELEEV